MSQIKLSTMILEVRGARVYHCPNQKNMLTLLKAMDPFQ